MIEGDMFSPDQGFESELAPTWTEELDSVSLVSIVNRAQISS